MQLTNDKNGKRGLRKSLDFSFALGREECSRNRLLAKYLMENEKGRILKETFEKKFCISTTSK